MTGTVTPAGDVADEHLARTQWMPVRTLLGREDDPLASVLHHVADLRHAVTVDLGQRRPPDNKQPHPDLGPGLHHDGEADERRWAHRQGHRPVLGRWSG